MQTLRHYMQIITEADNFVGGFDGRNGYFEVFKNPSRAQLNKIMQHDVARMFLLDAQDAIAWSPYGALHGELIYLGGEDLNLPRDALPMVAYIAGSKVSCDVTDASRRTDWYHNPATAAFIKQHAYLRKMFGSIEVTYFDEDIDGKWDEMTNESLTEARVVPTPAMEQLRQQFYFHLDNPGGDWLKYERERVAQRGKGGAMTAGLRGKDGGPEPALPLALLSKLAGARGEVRTATNPQVMKYAELMKTSGYTGEPLMIYVEFDGSATVGEGNHRIAAARLAGIPRLPVDVRYYTGAEQEVGLMSPDNIVKVVTAWDGDGRA